WIWRMPCMRLWALNSQNIFDCQQLIDWLQINEMGFAKIRFTFLVTKRSSNRVHTMDSVPQPIAEVVLSFVASGSREDRRNAMLVNSNWLWLARRTFYPKKTLRYAS